MPSEELPLWAFVSNNITSLMTAMVNSKGNTPSIQQWEILGNLSSSPWTKPMPLVGLALNLHFGGNSTCQPLLLGCGLTPRGSGLFAGIHQVRPSGLG